MKPSHWFYLYYICYPFFAFSLEASDIHEAGFIEDNFSDVDKVRKLLYEQYDIIYRSNNISR